MKSLNDYILEYKDRFKKLNDKEIADVFNHEVGNSGWGTSRQAYLVALKEDFERRGIDFSAIGTNDTLSFKRKIKVVNKKIIIDE